MMSPRELENRMGESLVSRVASVHITRKWTGPAGGPPLMDSCALLLARFCLDPPVLCNGQ